MTTDPTTTPTPTNEQQDARAFDQAPYLARALNWAGIDALANTPDYVLAEKLAGCPHLDAMFRAYLAAASAAAPDEREALARAFAEHHARKVVYAIDYEHADVALTALAARPAPTVSAVDPRHPAPVVSDGTDVRDLADRIETAMTDDGHRMPRTDETRYLAHVAAQTALAVVGQGVTAETAWDEGPLQVEYGLVWDDRGSADTFPTLEQARAAARGFDEPAQVVRIETWPVADKEGQE